MDIIEPKTGWSRVGVSRYLFAMFQLEMIARMPLWKRPTGSPAGVTIHRDSRLGGSWRELTHLVNGRFQETRLTPEQMNRKRRYQFSLGGTASQEQGHFPS